MIGGIGSSPLEVLATLPQWNKNATFLGLVFSWFMLRMIGYDDRWFVPLIRLGWTDLVHRTYGLLVHTVKWLLHLGSISSLVVSRQAAMLCQKIHWAISAMWTHSSRTAEYQHTPTKPEKPLIHVSTCRWSIGSKQIEVWQSYSSLRGLVFEPTLDGAKLVQQLLSGLCCSLIEERFLFSVEFLNSYLDCHLQLVGWGRHTSSLKLSINTPSSLILGAFMTSTLRLAFECNLQQRCVLYS